MACFETSKTEMGFDGRVALPGKRKPGNGLREAFREVKQGLRGCVDEYAGKASRTCGWAKKKRKAYLGVVRRPRGEKRKIVMALCA